LRLINKVAFSNQPSTTNHQPPTINHRSIMKKVQLLILTLFIAVSTTQAQITLTNSYFPNAGDSLLTATASPLVIRNFVVSPAGANQTWNYSYLRNTLNNNLHTSVTYLPVTADTAAQREFTDANLIVKTAGQTTCYKKSTTKLELVGFAGTRQANLALGINAHFSPYVIERRAPLVYNTQNNNTSSFLVSFPSSVIPDSILRTLPIRPDSFRINYQTIRNDKVDAWGSMTIPGSSPYQVIREKRTEITKSKIEIHAAGFPIWIDITGVIFTGTNLPIDTTYQYFYWSNTAKEPIATVTANSRDSVTSVEYKYLPINTSTNDQKTTTNQISISPNPSNGNITINSETPITGETTLIIFDTQGRETTSLKINLETSKASLQLNNLSSGLYIYTLQNQEGNPLANGKFVIEK
jgi:hypothetical protein